MHDSLLIDTQKELYDLVLKLEKEKILGVDLEMENNLHHYGVRLSVVQIATENEAWVIDLLNVRDPAPLMKLLSDSHILKVFHEVDFDFRVLHECYECLPRNVFDTKIAATLLGKTKLGLGDLLNEYFGVKKEKKFQRADWLMRPLSAEMISYAAKDAAYLIKLYRYLRDELEVKGRLGWAQEEFRLLEQADYTLKRQGFDDVKGVHSMTSHERGVFKELFLLRERLAKQVDRPVYFVIAPQMLVELAIRPFKTIAQWQKLRRVHPIVRKKAYLFLEAISKAQPITREVKQRQRPLTMSQQRSLQTLLDKRDIVAEKEQLPPPVICSKDAAITAIRGHTNHLRTWQKELLGLVR